MSTEFCWPDAEAYYPESIWLFHRIVSFCYFAPDQIMYYSDYTMSRFERAVDPRWVPDGITVSYD